MRRFIFRLKSCEKADALHVRKTIIPYNVLYVYMYVFFKSLYPSLYSLVLNFKTITCVSILVQVVNCLGMYSSPSSIYHLFTFDYARVSKGKKDKPLTSGTHCTYSSQ